MIGMPKSMMQEAAQPLGPAIKRTEPKPAVECKFAKFESGDHSAKKADFAELQERMQRLRLGLNAQHGATLAVQLRCGLIASAEMGCP